MSDIKVKTGAFKLSSSWAVTYVGNPSKPKITKGPTTGKVTKKFKYSLTSGAKIKSAYIYADIACSLGISTLTANGKAMKKTSGSTRRAKLTLKSNSTTLSVLFKFQSSGNTVYGNHSTNCNFSNVYLLIEYEGGTATTPPPPAPSTPTFKVPPQSVCIYDQKSKKIYMFDGVTKIQHSISVEFEESPSGKEKAKFVNNAKNEPDQVSIEVLMSDVYTGGDAILSKSKKNKKQKKAWKATKDLMTARESIDTLSRSEIAYYTIHWLKEKRHKLSVITPQFVYVDMLISKVSVNQSEACPFGWEGQIDFQGAIKGTKTENKPSSKTNDDEPQAPPSTANPLG